MIDGFSEIALRELSSAAVSSRRPADLRVLIVAENASEDYGGEAALPLRYFEALRARGVSTWLVTHSRVRHELSVRMPEALDRIHFIADSWLQRALWYLGRRLDHRLRYISSDFLSRLITQSAQCRLAKSLIERHGINVVHQPTPVSPLEPSLLKGLGAPVVFGPMNGVTNLPPAFRKREWWITHGILAMARAMAPVLNRLITGKRHAAVLLVANERSRAALFGAPKAQIFGLSENGVDTDVWRHKDGVSRVGPVCRFAFVGRLVQSKGVDLWLEAFQQALDGGSAMTGLVIGDGAERATLTEQARSAGILGDRPYEPGRIYFTGWQERAHLADLLAKQDCLVFPALCECGGAVILEAMAMELPVIATDWGGPADYVDGSCGILVRPDGKEAFVAGFARAMQLVAADPALRARMGQAGRRKIERSYSWDRKIESVLDVYHHAVGRTADHMKADDG